MKKIIIFAGMILLAVTVSAQRGSREQARQNTGNHKSEASSRQNLQHKRERSPAGRSTQTHTSTAGNRRDAGDRKPVRTTTHSKAQRGNSSAAGTGSRGTEHRRIPATTRTTRDARVNRTAPERETEHRRMPAATRETTRHSTVPPGRVRNEGTAGRNDRSPDTGPRRQYTTPDRRHVRNTHGVNMHYRPVNHHRIHYRKPGRIHVIWTRQMYHEYRLLYPDFRYWYYPVGYTIVTIPAYSAALNIGEVRNVYGRVHEVWYSWNTDEYYLYFGGAYPYQDFTVILPGGDARRINLFPKAFFEGRYIWVTGLVSTFEGKPEIMVRRSTQVHLY